MLLRFHTYYLGQDCSSDPQVLVSKFRKLLGSTEALPPAERRERAGKWRTQAQRSCLFACHGADRAEWLRWGSCLFGLGVVGFQGFWTSGLRFFQVVGFGGAWGGSAFLASNIFWFDFVNVPTTSMVMNACTTNNMHSCNPVIPSPASSPFSWSSLSGHGLYLLGSTHFIVNIPITINTTAMNSMAMIVIIIIITIVIIIVVVLIIKTLFDVAKL